MQSWHTPELAGSAVEADLVFNGRPRFKQDDSEQLFMCCLRELLLKLCNYVKLFVIFYHKMIGAIIGIAVSALRSATALHIWRCG
jgi:hypothetical protein